MVGPTAKREAVGDVRARFEFSERRACRLVGLHRSVSRYQSIRRDPEGLRERLHELCGERPRFGYPRLHELLRREGFLVNRKRVYRMYREDGLQVRRKKRKQVARAPRKAILAPTRPHERWSIDFVSDSLACGRAIRVLTVVDDLTRLSPVLEVDTSLPAERVTRALDCAGARYGWPSVIVVDNGPEFTSRAMDRWAYERGIELHFIEPGKPVQNAFVESFNGRFREECLNQSWFLNLESARREIEEWRVDYNTRRPHTAIGMKTPHEAWTELLSARRELRSPVFQRGASPPIPPHLAPADPGARLGAAPPSTAKQSEHRTSHLNLSEHS